MKTLTLTLIYTLLITVFVGGYNKVQAQNDYFDTSLGNLIEDNGAEYNQYNQQQYDDSQYENVIVQYADGSEYRSNQNNNNPNNPNQIVQNPDYNQTQRNNQQYPPTTQAPSYGSGLGENLYNRGNNNPSYNPKQNPNNMSGGYLASGNNPSPNAILNYIPNQNPNITQPVSNNTELNDFGVQPTRQLYSGSPHGPTPTSIPGGKVITTNQLQSMVMNGKNNTLIFDVLDGPQHLPGAIPASQGAASGSFSDQTQQRMGQFLTQVSRGNKQVAMVFYCQSNYCWMSYNAALRAINLGYSNVYWYRGGIEAWQNKGLSVQYASNNNRY